MTEDMQQTIQEFEQNRANLVTISAQKQQLELQQKMMEETLEVLEKTKEKKVYKAVGNIMVLSDTASVSKELNDSKESIALRVKTLKTQEDNLIEKLNKLKSTIEAAQTPATEKKSK